MSLSGVVSLLQYPCFALVKGSLGGDPLYVSDVIFINTCCKLLVRTSNSVFAFCRSTLLSLSSLSWLSFIPLTSIFSAENQHRKQRNMKFKAQF